jgi:hypothetical protein
MGHVEQSWKTDRSRLWRTVLVRRLVQMHEGAKRSSYARARYTRTEAGDPMKFLGTITVVGPLALIALTIWMALAWAI